MAEVGWRRPAARSEHSVISGKLTERIHSEAEREAAAASPPPALREAAANMVENIASGTHSDTHTHTEISCVSRLPRVGGGRVRVKRRKGSTGS